MAILLDRKEAGAAAPEETGEVAEVEARTATAEYLPLVTVVQVEAEEAAEVEARLATVEYLPLAREEAAVELEVEVRPMAENLPLETLTIAIHGHLMTGN
jgi:YbbR domain-containing protein